MHHLFPGDGGEHGGVVVAGLHVLPDRVRLLVRDMMLAEDGVDHLVGPRGYLMLRAQFVHQNVSHARDERLVYLSVHNHGGFDHVEFSSADLASHERGYPTLLALVQGLPVGALVFAPAAVAGDIWLPNGKRVRLKQATVIGRRRTVLLPVPLSATKGLAPAMYDRQVRLFGEAGQEIFRRAKVGIIGLGGIGSQLAELLGRLGVGFFVLVDPDRADLTNLPRLIAARRTDVLVSEASAKRLGILRPLIDRLRRRKVDLAARNIRRANPAASIERIFGSVTDQSVAERLLDCDYIFLAADTMVARLVFNALVNQYLIPGVQVGARVVTDEDTGAVADVFVASRPVLPGRGCLHCNSLIDPHKLQIEATIAEQAETQKYGTESPAPSVVTLNAVAAADAVNLFQFYMTSLTSPTSWDGYLRFRPLNRSVTRDEPRAETHCSECGRLSPSRFARGDGAVLPTRIT
ncbi:MAG: ThiF family adenylyltransferase [Stellaceae bacterium]